MKPDSRILLEEFADRPCLVSGEVVQDDVNLLPGRAPRDELFEKGNKLAAGVACGGFAVDPTGGGIQRPYKESVHAVETLYSEAITEHDWHLMPELLPRVRQAEERYWHLAGLELRHER